MRLEGRVASITGAGAGMGREAAVLFAREGARVVVSDADGNAGQETVGAVTDAGGEAILVTADVRDADDVQRIYAEGEKAFGKVDLLYNNAGIMHPDDASVVDTDEAIWDRSIDVNLKGVFLCCKHGIPALLRAGGGVIVNVSSFVAQMGAATPQIAYTASKGGVLSLTREIAVEFARQGIRANALCPGPVRTALMAGLLADPERRERRLVHIPMGRFAESREIVKAALFLASDDSSYMTGAALTVDGGLTAAYVTPE
ncbi:MAG: SDR family oxidoreductase [Actinomycetota bacterium]|nr:SDR family oxidoreductase [Actinomycetota bacterium]